MKDDQITQITVSTSRKLNHAVYGASDYESSDHFVSLGAEVNVGDNIVELHSELTELARELNNKALSRAILKIQGGYSWVDYLELLRQYRLGHLQINDTHTMKMNELQKSVLEEFKKLKRTK